MVFFIKSKPNYIWVNEFTGSTADPNQLSKHWLIRYIFKLLEPNKNKTHNITKADFSLKKNWRWEFETSQNRI